MSDTEMKDTDMKDTDMNDTDMNDFEMINKVDKKNKKFKNYILKDSRFIFGNLNGIIEKNYVKYFNLICFEILFTFIFALIYYILLLDANRNFTIPKDFKPGHFLNHKLLTALYMSVNFQSTVAYVDLKCKSFLSRTIINLQIVETVTLALLFLFV